MDTVKTAVLEISKSYDEINEQIDFNVNQFEVIDAFIETGKEEPKKHPVYPVLD